MGSPSLLGGDMSKKSKLVRLVPVPDVLSPEVAAELQLAQLRARVESIVAHCGMCEDVLHAPINWELIQTFVDEVNDDLAAMDQLASAHDPVSAMCKANLLQLECDIAFREHTIDSDNTAENGWYIGLAIRRIFQEQLYKPEFTDIGSYVKARLSRPESFYCGCKMVCDNLTLEVARASNPGVAFRMAREAWSIQHAPSQKDIGKLLKKSTTSTRSRKRSPR